MTTDLQRVISALEHQFEGTNDHESHQKNMTLANQIRELEVLLKINSTVAATIDSLTHFQFVLTGREWYKRFSEFHDSCQSSPLSWEKETIRVQGYTHGWNDAQRFLKETYVRTHPTPANYKVFQPTPTKSVNDN